MEAGELINKIFQGEVSAVHNYGAFVKIPGAGRTQGLVHKSQISSARVDDATEVLEVNEKVWCKVIGVSDDRKISLSMKVVDQGSGLDLDPNGVQISLDEQQRKERVGRGEREPITLDAILKTTCSNCGVAGHLSKNCFQVPGGKVYDLIPEPEKEVKVFGSVQDRLKRLANAGIETTNTAEVSPPKKTKKEKDRDRNKKDRSKSKKKSKYRSASDSSSDCKETRKSKTPVQKKHKPKKVSRRHDSTDDSSDSDESPRKKIKEKRHHKHDSTDDSSDSEESPRKKMKKKRHHKQDSTDDSSDSDESARKKIKKERHRREDSEDRSIRKKRKHSKHKKKHSSSESSESESTKKRKHKGKRRRSSS